VVSLNNNGENLMKKIFAIAWKDLKLRFSSPVEWLFFLILPVIFTLVIAGGTGGTNDSRARLVVVDLANSPLSAQLITALGESETIRPEMMPIKQAEDEFSRHSAPAVLVIPAEFDIAHLEQKNITLELRQQPNNMSAMIAQRAVLAQIGRLSSTVDIANNSVKAAESIQPFESSAARQAYFDEAFQEAQSLMEQAPARVMTAQGSPQDPIQFDPRSNSSAGQLITWVFIPLIGISSIFSYERQKGTLRRLLTTPTQKATYLLGTITGQVVTALVQMLLLIGFGILMLKLNWVAAPLALAVMLISFTLAAAALGTMLGTFVKTEGQANGISMLLGMTMALLGGCWYPIEMFPQFVRTAVKVLPTSWAMQGLLDIVLRGQGLAVILLPAAVLMGFAAAFFSIGIWRFRYE
jgi:linearmycin/streptolysin S transport system permease protein